MLNLARRQSRWLLVVLAVALILGLEPAAVRSQPSPVTKTATPQTVERGQVVTFQISYNANYSSESSQDVTITRSSPCPVSNPNTNVVISGDDTVVSCQGTMVWRSLKVSDFATLTSEPASYASDPNQSQLTVILLESLTLQNRGKIDVSAKGMPGGATHFSNVSQTAPAGSPSWRNDPTWQWYTGSDGAGQGWGVGWGHPAEDCHGEAYGGGGSHGGQGGGRLSSTIKSIELPAEAYRARPVYGIARTPTTLGSGGAASIGHSAPSFFTGCKPKNWPGGAGGGAIHLIAKQLTMDKVSSIRANGADGNDLLGGGGAGGSILVQVEQPVKIHKLCLLPGRCLESRYLEVDGGSGGFLTGEDGATGSAYFDRASRALPGVFDVQTTHDNLAFQTFARGGGGKNGGGGGRIAVRRIAEGTLAQYGGVPVFELRDELPEDFIDESATPEKTGCPGLGPGFVCWNNSVIDPDNDGLISGTIELPARTSDQAACGTAQDKVTATNRAFLIVRHGAAIDELPAGTVTVEVRCPAQAAPNLTVSASPNPVGVGQPFTFSWTSTNASAITSSVSPESCPDAGSLTPLGSGSKTLTAPGVAAICSYAFTAIGPGGSSTKTITMTVVPRPGLSCTASESSVAPAQSFSLSCTSTFTSSITTAVSGTGCPSAGSLTPTGTGSTPVVATKTLSAPGNPTTCTYTITATGSGGTTTQTIVVTVGITSCGLLVCINYDSRVITLPPPGFTRIVQPFITEVAP